MDLGFPDVGVDAHPTDMPRRSPLVHDAQCGATALDAGTPDASDLGPPDGDAGGAAYDDLLRPGPYGAGVTTIMLTDTTRSRVLPVDVWYPIDPATTSGEPNAYYLDATFATLASLCSPARRDATPIRTGPWPLVVFSHGFGGVRFQSFYLTEHLATHGFVVAAPDHPGNTFADFAMLSDDAAIAQSAVDRPLDMMFVTDRMLADGGGLSLSIDATRVAISGHSFGGWTSLETARRDPRFRVVVPLAPGFRAPSTPDFVATLARPLIIFGGSVDHTCPFPTSQQAPYDLAAPPKALVDILGAGHLDFSDLCEVDIARMALNDGCDPASLDPQVVRDRVNVLALAFLERYLNGDASFDARLDPTAVSTLGNIVYSRAP